MKKITQIIKERKGFIAPVILMLIVASCIVIDSLQAPTQLNAGQIETFTLNTTITTEADVEDDSLVVAILMPTSWNARQNTTITYTSSIDGGVETMSPLPLNETPTADDTMTWSEKLYDYFGMGPNLSGDMEWIAFATDKAYDIASEETVTAEITIETLVGTENLSAHLGFFVNYVTDGFNYEEDEDDEKWEVIYSDCLPVVGASGAHNNYCEELSVDDHQLAFSSPYPNPFSDEVYLPLTLNPGENVEVNLYDIMGKRVGFFQSKTTSANYDLPLSSNLELAKLNPGIYLISVKSGEYSSTFKIIKE